MPEVNIQIEADIAELEKRAPALEIALDELMQLLMKDMYSLGESSQHPALTALLDKAESLAENMEDKYGDEVDMGFYAGVFAGMLIHFQAIKDQ